MQNDTHIMHADLDSFFVSVERILDPSLMGKPVIVGGNARRGVVASCSYEARAFGIHSAMPTRKAHQLCPQAIFVHGSSSEYSRYSRMVTDVIADAVPLFEKASIDEFYIDLSGMEKFFGCFDYATKLRKRIIKETGLPISIGLSVNKMMAKMATNQAKPNGALYVKAEDVQSFLEPLPIGKIPFLGEKTEVVLHKMNVRTIAELRALPMEVLTRKFGKQGLAFYNRSRGIASATINSFHEAKSLSAERTFDNDTNDKEWLQRVVALLAEKLAQELREEEFLTSCVTIKLRHPDFTTVSKQMQIDFTASSKKLVQHLLHLFNQFYVDGTKIRLLGIRFADFVKGNYQTELFDDDENTPLYKAIDEVKLKYGTNKVMAAENIGMKNVKRNNDVRSAAEKEEE